MRATLHTAGEVLEIACDLAWVAERIEEGAAGELREGHDARASVTIHVEADHRPFPTDGWEPVTRGAWRRAGEVVVRNACTSGFDVHVAAVGDGVECTYRWRPPARDRAAAWALRSRARLLARAVLIQYPALWWASVRGRAPLHASACDLAGRRPLISGPGGVGRSTLLSAELEAGGAATGDNLAVADGETVWGLVEPVRVEGGSGRRMPHGRREAPLPARAAALRPDCLVVLARPPGAASALAPCGRDDAARALAGATYMAPELRRFWELAATLAAGTGAGPAHPPVAEVARAFASRLPCFSLTLGRAPGPALADLLDVEMAA
jgi:hypothetical protein